MAAAENRRRRRKQGGADDRRLWGSLFRRNVPGVEYVTDGFYGTTESEEGEEPEQSLLRRIWRRFNLWSCIAVLLFVVFTGGLMVTVYRMWLPQTLDDVAGYSDRGKPRDLTALLKNANGAEISFTEGEVNRYLRDTCRMRQTGPFSLLAHVQGVAVRMHDGYVELVVDRVIGVNLHQTTAVNLSFRQDVDHGRPVLKVFFHGGAPLMGSMPRGGSIGHVNVPQRHIEMLRPALDTLVDCYPDIARIIEDFGYCPEFTAGRNGAEGRVRLVPYTPTS